MHRSVLSLCCLSFLLSAPVFAQTPGEVAIYTGTTQWIAKNLADEQAQICVDKLTGLGITNTLYPSDLDMDALATWVINATDNGKTDVLVLYGDLPPTLYPDGNVEPDGTVAELFIESEDGDAIINHADYMFWGLNARNSEGGLQNMMDLPGILMWDDNTPVTVTASGSQIAPSLVDFQSDRPFHVDELANEWVVEVALAQNATGTRADPIVVRDGPRGRLIPVFQTADEVNPKGAVAAEIIAWLFGIPLPGPSKLSMTGPGAAFIGRSIPITVQVQGSTGSPAAVSVATTINLSTNGASGAYDLSASGPFNGSVTSVVVPAGEATAVVYYRDTVAGSRTLGATAGVLTAASHGVNIFAESHTPAGEVAIYTGTTQWITKALADEQAQICVDKLDGVGIIQTWYQSDLDWEALTEWVTNSTNNGKQDVLVLYGDLPTPLYPDGNTQPDGSVAEAFIESTDGDAIINHADYMFWGLNARNQVGGLENMMDLPGVVMWDDNTPVSVTPDGNRITPSLTDFQSDRPFHLDQLANNWLAEVIFAQNTAGTRADPVIVRDGDLGRLIPIYQTADELNPKGDVSFEIIAWLMGVSLPAPTQILLSGPGAAITGRPSQLKLRLVEDSGAPRNAVTPITINLASSAATGRFDTTSTGAFDGSVTSVVVPAGSRTASFYYKDTTEATVTVTVSATGLAQSSVTINLYDDACVTAGEVVIYTGTTQWIAKDLADAQATICSDTLNAAGIYAAVLPSDQDMQAVADWVVGATDNGKLDVLVLYGDLPPTIYPDLNVEPDGSIAESFIESTDGDVILNHADYMFWGLNARNSEGGLQNMMDIPGIVMWDDNTAVNVTVEGAAVSPSLVNFLSDRPFHLDQLANEWFPELILAQNAAGTRADPVIVRDGNRGRLIPVQQAADQNDPKGAVAAEIISWLMGRLPTSCGAPAPTFHRGDADDNGKLELTDAIRILNYLFTGGVAPACFDAADADDNGKLELTDAIRILNYLFTGGIAPAPPGPPSDACGVDVKLEEPDLGCAKYTHC